MIETLQPIPASRRHPADYRDELEHAEVARILADWRYAMHRFAVAAVACVLTGCLITPEELLKEGDVRELRSDMSPRLAALCVSRNAENRPVDFRIVRLSEAELPGLHELVLNKVRHGGFLVFRMAPNSIGSTIRVYSPQRWPNTISDVDFSALTKGC